MCGGGVMLGGVVAAAVMPALWLLSSSSQIYST